jgi:hypothetical protein
MMSTKFSAAGKEAVIEICISIIMTDNDESFPLPKTSGHCARNAPMKPLSTAEPDLTVSKF